MQRNWQTPGKFNRAIYRPRNIEVAKLLADAAALFNNYKIDKNEATLTNSLKLFQKATATAASEHNPRSFDKAHAYRRYASALNDAYHYDNNHKMQLALLKCEVPIRILYSYVLASKHNEQSAILLELTASLDLLRSLGYRTQDGEVIERAADQTIQLYKHHHLKADEILVRAYEAKFHCHFARCEINAATKYHHKATEMALVANCKYKAGGHSIKLKLVELEAMRLTHQSRENIQTYFENEIEAPFWDVYDEAKNLYRLHSSHTNAYYLQKTMQTLLNIRCIRAAIGLQDRLGRTPLNYVRTQANKEFKNNSAYCNKTKQALHKLISQYQTSNGLISLSYAYFLDIERPLIQLPRHLLHSILETSEQTKLTLNEDTFFYTKRRDRLDTSKPAPQIEWGETQPHLV